MYNKEERARYMREWRRNNPERSREIHDRANQKWRANNKHELVLRTALFVRKKRDELLEFFGNKCVRCGFGDKRALELDHVNGDGFKYKRGQLHGGGEGHNIGRFIKNIKANPHEAKKRFQLLCANCHRIKTSECKEYCFKTRLGYNVE
jgi:hypothetical protein